MFTSLDQNSEQNYSADVTNLSSR